MKQEKELLTINQVSKKVGISKSRLREYEQENLIKPKRNPKSRYRLYSNEDIIQIKIIHDLIHNRGLTITAIKYIVNSVNCWRLFNCWKWKCPAYNNIMKVCWEVTNMNQDNECYGDCTRCIRFLNKDNSFNIEGLIRPNKLKSRNV